MTTYADSGGPGAKPYFNGALLATKQAVKTSPGRLYGWHIQNPNSADAWVQFFDLASGAVTVGTTTPSWSLYIPALAVLDDPTFTIPLEFNVALVIAATTSATGSGAPGTGLVTNLFYR